MNKEVISDKQGISILILFMSSTSTVLMVALSAEGDFWLAIILSAFIAFVISFIFISLHNTFPGKNFFEICEACFGKFIGKLICILYIYFVFEEGASVLTNAKQFITDINLPETPEVITIIPIMLLCVWAGKKGIELIGNISRVFVVIFIILVLAIVILLLPQMDMNNFEPILYKGFNPVFKGIIEAFTFPFGEIVMLSMVFSNFKTKKSPYKVYIIGLLGSMIISLLIATTTVLVLGIDIAKTSYYPVFNAATKINIGDFIQRIEIIVVLIGVAGAFIKNSILLLAVCIGISKVFNLTNYRFILIPISLLMINYSSILFDSRMEFIKYTSEAWSYYAVVFEVFIPILVLITAKIRKKKLRGSLN